MEKTKNILIVSAYVLLMVLFFFGGYIIGGIQQGDIAVIATPQPVTVPAAAIDNTIKYELILSNSELCLYKNSNNSHELLYAQPIIESFFPSDDIDELRNGIFFDNLSDAQSLLENFVS